MIHPILQCTYCIILLDCHPWAWMGRFCFLLRLSVPSLDCWLGCWFVCLSVDNLSFYDYDYDYDTMLIKSLSLSSSHNSTVTLGSV